MRSFTRMCRSLVARTMWMRGRAAGFVASAEARMSAWLARDRLAITGPSLLKRRAMDCTLSKSPGEAMAKPASSTSAPSSCRASAMRSFSSRFIEKPGDCSPSRRVVSKMMMRPGASVPKEGWFMVVLALVSWGLRFDRPLGGAGRVMRRRVTPRGGEVEGREGRAGATGRHARREAREVRSASPSGAP
jgi:hypothetical protein